MKKDLKNMIIMIIALVAVGATAYYFTRGCKNCKKVCFSSGDTVTPECTVICEE